VSSLDFIHALYDYNEWATVQILDAASSLSEDDLSRDLGASFGSVQGNLSHILSAQTIWLSRWTGEEFVAPPQPEPGRALQTLRDSFAASHAGLRAFVSSLSESDLDREFSYTDTQGNAQRRVLWQAMLHVANHGTHHRAEAAMLLTSLGYPPRQLDLIFFELERAGGPPRLT
jgi:uncharacterized damage-inducible protein DinB